MGITIRVKRIYDDASRSDGFRILVDRLWPRGVSKEAARIDLWAKSWCPSHDLRKWFHQNPSQEDELAERYRAELLENIDEVQSLMESLKDQEVLTLVTSTKDLEKRHTAVLKRFLVTRWPTRESMD
ncbi:hypothetical protein KOR42_37860 [Thalassoglobus neptunius]|uniref:Uncharacterized protein n=1 Tax=Thalassoglobus neptunius TaxID=1938619 RepID=A0A5C5WGR2_9PLAN|nr:DUF488 family protein [Thalassoglobus neptunius]TWT49968.1 hypothetical protein KOR42_37860 [Thalassoglobus neptunius]